MTREYHEGYQQGYKDAKEESKELTAKNDLEVREFEGIEVTYPSEEVCIYPEYKGKPYFAIKYKENGKEMVGYGTYNPEVLSQYLKDYFISTTKNNLGVDDEERELALMYLEQIKEDYIEGVGYERHPLPEYYAIETAIKSLAMPSVTPQEPRKGHWLHRPHVYGVTYCSICDFGLKIDNTNYCPNCGAKMESEDT